MNLQEQIKYTEAEYKAYSQNKYACPAILEWLKGVLDSLYLLQNKNNVMNKESYSLIPRILLATLAFWVCLLVAIH